VSADEGCPFREVSLYYLCVYIQQEVECLFIYTTYFRTLKRHFPTATFCPILIGSLPFFCQPIGSIASGFIVQWLGRKKFLMIINIPYFVGCVLISTAPSITALILANTLLGTTVGLCEAPLNSYFGEICQPSLRSILTGSAGNIIFSLCRIYSRVLIRFKGKITI
jgi:MFS family permease